MRFLLAILLALAAFPLALPTTGACHMPLEYDGTDSAWQVGIINTPNEPHAGPVDFHWHECGDGHAWVCVHRVELDVCVQTW